MTMSDTDRLRIRRCRLEAALWKNHCAHDAHVETTEKMGNFGLFDSLAHSPSDLAYMRRIASLRNYTDEVGDGTD